MTTRDLFAGPEPETGAELVSALASFQTGERDGGPDGAWPYGDPSDPVLASVPGQLDRIVPAEAPPETDPAGRRAWLNGIETLSLAVAACRTLAPARPWARKVEAVLDGALTGLGTAFTESRGWWRCGRLAAEGRKRRSDTPPWNWFRDGVGTGEIDTGVEPVVRSAVIEAWLRGDLSPADSAAAGRFVADVEEWRREYRAALLQRCRPVRAVAVPAPLRLAPILSLPLPHLGPEARLEARLADGGIDITRSGKPVGNTLWQPDGSARLTAGDDTTGPLELHFERIETTLPTTTLAAVSTLSAIERNPAFPREQAAAIARCTAHLLSDGKGWKGRLLSAARAFTEGSAVAEEDLQLVERAVEARAGLDVIVYRYLDPVIGTLVAGLDQELAPAADAVLALPPERYRELLLDADPEPGSWWAARLVLDDELPDDLLSEVPLVTTYEPARAQTEPVTSPRTRSNRLADLVRQIAATILPALPQFGLLDRLATTAAAADSPDIGDQLRSWPAFRSASWMAAVTVNGRVVRISVRPCTGGKERLAGALVHFLGADRPLGRGDAPGVVEIPIEAMDHEESARRFVITDAEGIPESLAPEGNGGDAQSGT